MINISYLHNITCQLCAQEVSGFLPHFVMWRFIINMRYIKQQTVTVVKCCAQILCVFLFLGCSCSSALCNNKILQALCQQDKYLYIYSTWLKLLCLWSSVFTDKHCIIYIIKITVTVTPCDINPVNIFRLWSAMLPDSPRGLRVLESLNLGHCKTSAATAAHTSATIGKDIWRDTCQLRNHMQFFRQLR